LPQLVISKKTVSAHLEHIYAKLGVTTRTRAALFAVQQGLVALQGASAVDG
jgi:DNA-binding NarL/FixJ family response regulator